MICCSCGKEIDINYGREYWDGIYCKKCADEILSTPEYIKNYEKNLIVSTHIRKHLPGIGRSLFRHNDQTGAAAD